MKVNSNQNIFVYGLTGSGKDSVSNYLVENYGYFKLRIADTIKRVICEALNISFEELEEQKRTNSELRMLHHIVSQMFDDLAKKPQSSINRVEQLINGKAFDFHNFSVQHDKVLKVICDCRTISEAKKFLEAGWTGIFLSRTTDEFRHASHFTEQYMFTNGELQELINVFGFNNQVKIIYNNSGFSESDTKVKDCDICKAEISLSSLNRKCTDGSLKELHIAIDDIIKSIYTE